MTRDSGGPGEVLQIRDTVPKRAPQRPEGAHTWAHVLRCREIDRRSDAVAPPTTKGPDHWSGPFVLAVAVRFELTVDFHPHTLSRRAP